MTETKKRYTKKCKVKTVTFYLNEHEQALYDYANSINFQAFVKNALIDAIMKGGK